MVQRASKATLHGWVACRHEPKGALAEHRSVSGTGSATRDRNRDEGRTPPLQGTWDALKVIRRAQEDVGDVTGTSPAPGTTQQGLVGTPSMSRGALWTVQPNQHIKNKLH